MQFTLTIELLSDTCFSMPAAGTSTVDSEASADNLGLPHIPGKTLHGLLRDTWLSLPEEMDPPDRDGHRLGHRLLGAQFSHGDLGILRIGDALTHPDVRTAIRWATHREGTTRVPASAVQEAFYGRRTLTRVDRETGAPATDTLRVVRVVPAGTRLYAPITTREDLTAREREMLDLLLGLTRHAGLDRNRGLGHVRLSLRWDGKPSFPALKEQAATSAGETVFLHYRLTLTAPCIFRSQDRDPHSCSTLPYVPGTALRGALAEELKRQQSPDAEIEAIVASQEVRFLNAYIEAGDERSLPVPITWRRVKSPLCGDDDVNARTHDALFALFNETAGLPELQQAPVNASFAAADPDSTGYFSQKVATVLETHQARNRARGVSVKDETTVFVYQALKPGQGFRGCIAVTGSPDLQQRRIEQISRILQRTSLWMGRSARSGYGGAPTVEILGVENAEVPEGYRPVEIRAGRVFEVCLTAPAVLRDPLTGQHDPWQLKAALTKHFEQIADVAKVCVKAGVLRSYSRLWRTEMSRTPCVAAGSVALLRAKRPISAGDAEAIQSIALGERVSEGCGCFVIRPLDGEMLKIKDARVEETQEPLRAEGALLSADLLLAQRRLYDCQLRRLAGDQALIRANAADLRKISPSTLQRMRSPLRDDATWQQTYADWFENGRHALRPTALSDLRKVRLKHDEDDNFPYVWLADLLTAAADPGWLPPLRDEAGIKDEAGSYENWEHGAYHSLKNAYRLIPDPKAQELWRAAKAAVGRLYLDTLLARLSRNAAGTREGRQ